MFKQEKTTEPRHLSMVDYVEKNFGGDGHKHHQHEFKKHAAGHELEQERVEKMCHGGKTK
jgi:hypothetical protein